MRYTVAIDTPAGFESHTFRSVEHFTEWAKIHAHGRVTHRAMVTLSGRPVVVEIDHRQEALPARTEQERRLREQPDEAIVVPDDYMPQCSACYLQRTHTFQMHRESIALHEVWGKVQGPWRDPRSESVRQAITDHVADIRSGAIVPQPDFTRF
jgi:hypothetical protein